LLQAGSAERPKRKQTSVRRCIFPSSRLPGVL
jgi:hypothetical protein